MKKWSHLLALLIVLQMLSVALYIQRAGQLGFPLDDAWIHQTYARNLGLHGVMAFTPGQPSTGSTSFGWTLLLALGYFLEIPFFFWTYLLGSLFAIATALVAARLSEMYFGSYRNAVLVAVLCILEWRLAWAAVSGMEIGLFAFLVLFFFLLLHRNSAPIVLGFVAGIVALVRPEGILLALAYGLKLFLTRPYTRRSTLFPLATFLLSFAILILPWILFNYTYSHRPFPSTITAKFMQYGYPWSLGRSLRYLWDVLLYFLNGPLVLLLPAAGFSIYRLVRVRTPDRLYPLAWSAALIGLYSIALPVIYDHGRYLMPLIPLVLIYGVEGLIHLLNRFVQTVSLGVTARAVLLILFLVLWINGASDYAYRIQLYGAVHMQAAQWINANVPQDEVIATHDIGILGYFTERPIVDLAGLVTPEVVPIMDEPQTLAEYLQGRQVHHLIVYSGYYRELLEILHARVVYSPGADQLRAMGVEPFEIHEVRIP